jgi:hypothetical protein
VEVSSEVTLARPVDAVLQVPDGISAARGSWCNTGLEAARLSSHLVPVRFCTRIFVASLFLSNLSP